MLLAKDAEIVDNGGYWVIKQVLSQASCEMLSDYVQFKASIRPNVRKNADPLHNIQREYGDAMMELLLQQLTPLVEKAVGKALWPTLSFCYVYKSGNTLLKHKDRSSCEWVVSVCLGADEAFKNAHESWPINLNLNGKTEAVALNCGDMVLFRGHETEHWRDVFSGAWFVSAIFAYVEQEGPFAFQKFDQRKALGKPHVGMFRWAFGCLKQKIRMVFRFKLASG